MSGPSAIYRNRHEGELARLVVELPKDELDRVDHWGGPAGFPSRTAAVRHLLKRGLEAAITEPAAGHAS